MLICVCVHTCSSVELSCNGYTFVLYMYLHNTWSSVEDIECFTVKMNSLGF